MTASARAHPEPPEPVSRQAPGTGSGLSAPLVLARDTAVAWAGEGLVALLMSGSHASGEAVWADVSGRRVSLSDLDLYAILRDEPGCRAAAARAATGRRAAAHALAEAGLAAPLEVAFVTLEGLARMPARPGTVELARAARVLAGDAGVLARLPRWSAAGVSAEERLLLLENRAFELLGALPGGEDGLPSLRARHAVLKAALDVAAAHSLGAHELPPGSAARVAAARALGPWSASPSWLEGAWETLQPVWDEAVSSRSSGMPAATGGPSAGMWHAVARGWCAGWWEASAAFSRAEDAWNRALGTAARAPLRRRLRQALGSGGHDGGGARLRLAFAGTPQHRIHGTATVLLLAAATSAAEPRLPAGALHALHRLGVSQAREFGAAARDALRAWDRRLHAGVRTADEP